MLGFTKHHNKFEEGQSLVEAALGLVIIITIFMGIADLGRAYFIMVALEDSAGEAALYLSLNPECQTEASREDMSCANPNNTEFRARSVGGVELDWDRVDVRMSVPENYSVGDIVTVEVRYQFDMLMPFIRQVIGSDRLNLNATASQIILTERVAEQSS
ncbi:MAG: pilus assembly protein [Anaerolineaceae bacterium]|nr:MAG: pilus assembly protein [Anaerolineaceae bacterium]